MESNNPAPSADKQNEKEEEKKTVKKQSNFTP